MALSKACLHSQESFSDVPHMINKHHQVKHAKEHLIRHMQKARQFKSVTVYHRHSEPEFSVASGQLNIIASRTYYSSHTETRVISFPDESNSHLLVELNIFNKSGRLGKCNSY